MKSPLIHVADMIFNQPLAIMPEKLEVILRAIGPRLVVDDTPLHSLFPTGQSPIVLLDPVTVDQPKQDKPYKLTADGIAVIPIRGTLMKRFNFLSASSGCCSYQSLGDAAMAAIADPNVKGVLWDVDSPGGSTHGCFELAEMLYGLRNEKPMWAIANDLAASAAYALASASTRLLVTRTGGVGSVGVFALHADQSGADEQAGIKYTYIFAGDKKTDGNPHQPLSKSARADVQAEVDREYGMFLQCVSRNRGADLGRFQNTEAAVFFGENAKGLMADGVMTCDEAIAALTEYVNKSTTKITVASQTFSENNAPNSTTALPADSEDGMDRMPAIAPHQTATSEKPWNGPRAKANLKNDGTKAYYRSAFAWQDAQGDPAAKASYKFIHHEVSSGGDVGAANIKACQSSIGILNGGRGGTVVSKPDRRGIYRHVAAHLKDARLEPAPLASYQTYIAGVLSSARDTGDERLHAMAIDFLLAADEESTVEGEQTMPLDTLVKRAKRSEAEAQEEVEDEKDKEEKEEDEDEEDDEDEDDKKKSDSKKSESKKSRRTEAKKDDMDDDECEGRKGRKGELVELERVANGPARRIAALCKLASAPELAVDFIAAGYDVDKVIEELNARRAKASSDVGVRSYVTGQSSGDATVSIDQAIRQAQTFEVNSAGAMTRSQALEKILRMNPQIYESYLDERDRVIAMCPGGRGQALTNYVLTSQRRYMQQLGLSTIIDDVPGRRSI